MECGHGGDDRRDAEVLAAAAVEVPHEGVLHGPEAESHPQPSDLGVAAVGVALVVDHRENVFPDVVIVVITDPEGARIVVSFLLAAVDLNGGGALGVGGWWCPRR